MTADTTHRYEHIHAGSLLGGGDPSAILAWHNPAQAPTLPQGLLTRSQGRPAAVSTGSKCVFIELVKRPRRSAPAFRDKMERTRRDLERLADGWCGEGSAAPSESVFSDLDRLLEALPENTTVPQVEVDQDTGAVTLRWQRDGLDRALSFIVKGTGQIIAADISLSGKPRAESRRFEATNCEAVERYVASDSELTELLGA
jgi:hypothetical protein